MRRFERAEIWHHGDPVNLSGAHVEESTFNQCVVRSVPRSWNRLADIHLSNAKHWNCALSGCLFDEVYIRDLRKTGSAPLFVWASAFRRVTLSGVISGLKINRADMQSDLDPSEVIWREQALLSHYAEVDWALDISRAKFPNGATFEALPGDKIIRDPDTQVLVRRGTLAGGEWRSLDFKNTAIDIALSWFEAGSLFESVVVVPRSASKYRVLDTEVIDMLRREGIADGD